MNSYENKIRFKAIAVYVFIAIMLAVITVYIYNLGKNITSQKSNIEGYYDILRLTNQIVFSVSETQSSANLFLATNNRANYASFHDKAAETGALIDSLVGLTLLTDDTASVPALRQINALLVEKGELIFELNSQLSSYEPVDSLAKRLLVFETPLIIRDSLTITTVVSDTVVKPADKLNFWDRVPNVFSPRKYEDTVVTVTNVSRDTLNYVRQDSVALAEGTRRYVTQLMSGYTSRITAISRQVTDLLGTDQEISAQIIELLDGFHRTIIRSTLQNIEASEEIIQRNYRMSLAGILLSLIIVSVFIVLIISDANKGIRARIDLERANEKIRQVMESRHKLFTSISHDIKTPLNSLLGYLSIWRRGQVPESAELESAENSGRHINALISNLLEFSTLEQGKSTTALTTIDPVALCRSISDMFRPLIEGRDIEIVTRFEFPDGTRIVSDDLKLRQILTNLLSNAVKYTREGKITFTARLIGEQLRFRIEDTGVGISPDDIAKIYQPFTRIEGNSSMAAGHGMGMFVVKGLVELLEGTIETDSAVGRGTTVSVAIPARTAEKEICQARDAVTAKKIFVIDDDPVFLGVIEQMLTREGHHVTASTGLNALTDPSAYDLIITDMQMGPVSGLDVLHKVRESDITVPVTAMTGHYGFTADEAARHGFSHLIRKPFDITALEAVLGGGGKPITATDSDFVSLEELLGGDREMIKEVVSTFVNSLSEDIKKLRQHWFRRDFRAFSAVCHRILPMFIQLGNNNCIALLKEIDSMKEHRNVEAGFWKRIPGLLSDMEEFETTLREKYLI